MWHEDYRGAPADGSAWTHWAVVPALWADGTTNALNFRVFRGGSWSDTSSWLRGANRFSKQAGLGYRGRGFRVVLTSVPAEDLDTQSLK